jgi:hypothetical protein
MGQGGSDENGKRIGGHSMLCPYGNDLGGAGKSGRAFEEVKGAGETPALRKTGRRHWLRLGCGTAGAACCAPTEMVWAGGWVGACVRGSQKSRPFANALRMNPFGIHETGPAIRKTTPPARKRRALLCCGYDSRKEDCQYTIVGGAGWCDLEQDVLAGLEFCHLAAIVG